MEQEEHKSQLYVLALNHAASDLRGICMPNNALK